MEGREDSIRRYSSHMQPNWGFYRKPSRDYARKYSDHYDRRQYDRYRDKNFKYSTFQMPYSRHVKSQSHVHVISQSSKEDHTWSEEVVELKRRQQISDTATKLTKKLKAWNREKNEKKDHSSNCSYNEVTNKSDNQNNEAGQQRGQSKIRKNPAVENETRKKVKVNSKNIKKITSPNSMKLKKINKSAGPVIPIKQKKIQQNIIGELMAMPKEKLNKVFVNPKINPKLEKEMAQIVKENRLILAQKFRTLAESKINCQGQSQFQSKFLLDVENLIDPYLAIDLCQLSPEMIKQISEIFQLDFESPMKSTESQEEIESSLISLENKSDKGENCSDSSSSSFTSVSEKRNDYDAINAEVQNQNECTTEILEYQEDKIGKITVKNFANLCGSYNVLGINEASGTDLSIKSENEKTTLFCNNYDSTIREELSQGNFNQNNSFFESETIMDHSDFHNSASNFGSETKKIANEAAEHVVEQVNISHNTEDQKKNNFGTEGESVNGEIINFHDDLEVENSCKRKSCGSQTDIKLLETYLNVNLENKVGEDVEKTHMYEELKKVDRLIHALNKRRFLLFLKLVNLDNYKGTNSLKNYMLKVITNFDKSVMSEKGLQSICAANKTEILNSTSGKGRQAKKKEKSKKHKTGQQQNVESDNSNIFTSEPDMNIGIKMEL